MFTKREEVVILPLTLTSCLSSVYMTFLPPGSTETADLAVSIVSWNVKDLLVKNLQTLFKSAGEGVVRVIVVDNASKDGTQDVDANQFPNAHFIKNTQNVGFSRANNQAIAIANARHMLLLNPDMRVEPTTLSQIINELDANNQIGVLGGHLLNADGSTLESVRRFPTLADQLAILLKLPHIFPKIVNKYLAKGFDYTKPQSVDSIRGSLFAISETALKRQGGLDERYFIWFEEVDYCKSMHKLGLEVRYEPSIQAQDFVGQSFAQRKRYWKQVQFSRSMAQYFQKWHPIWQSTLIWILRPFPIAIAWIADKF